MITYGDEKGRIINIDSKILKAFDEKYISYNSSAISIVKYSPNGETLVCGTSKGELWILNGETRKYVLIIHYHQKGATAEGRGKAAGLAFLVHRGVRNGVPLNLHWTLFWRF